MTFAFHDPSTWPCFRPLIIAHDVGRTRDRSTAVVGGNCPMGAEYRTVGIRELVELPQGLFASARANQLAAIDRQYWNDALIVADLSNDASYAEILYETFGVRVIGLQITRFGDGMTFERRLIKRGAILVYTIGRSFLIEQFHGLMQSGRVKFVDGPMSRKAFAQLADLETEMHETGMVYKCAAGRHDDLGMSCAMLAWAARHPHTQSWSHAAMMARRPRRTPPDGAAVWKACT
jgi:hypothetical protein